MKRMLTILLALTLTSTAAMASTWKIDPDHSNAQFKVKHMMISTVRGDFPVVNGTLQLDDKDIRNSSVDVAIDVATLDSGVEKRDNHLRSADFFDVATFPAMTFKSSEVRKNGNDELEVAGDLTIRGISKPVVLKVDGPSEQIVDPWGNTRIAFSGETEVNRKDFGLTWNKTLDGGGIVISDDVKILLEVQMIKQP